MNIHNTNFKSHWIVASLMAEHFKIPLKKSHNSEMKEKQKPDQHKHGNKNRP